MQETVSAPEDSHLPSLYADVIVPRHLPGPFTYAVPPRLRPVLEVGQLVLVPLGRSKVQGAVIALSRTLPHGLETGKLKEILDPVTGFGGGRIPPAMLQLARKVAEICVAPWGQCLRLVMPPVKARGNGGVRYGPVCKGREALTTTMRRFDGSLYGGDVDSRFTGTLVPGHWEKQVAEALKSRQPRRLLLQGTLEQRVSLLCSGVRRALTEGRAVLVIAGEAERAEWLASMIARDLTVRIACFHSGLSEGARGIVWEQALQNRLQVVVGTRSALFLPLAALGLIWIDRDEDSALKEPQEPRYYAPTVAWLRAQDEQALLLLSSPHLSIETIDRAESPDCILRQPVPSWSLTKIEVVDLRRQRQGTVLSPLLVEAVHEALGRGRRAVLFLNRKGYAGALVCRDCGQVPRCASCHVALVCYRHRARLSCSYCGTSAAIPHTCPTCAGSHLRLVGEGTERVEEEARRHFPSARIVRADGDMMQKPAQAAALWERVRSGEWDVLVGTQIVLREYMIPVVSVVGVVQADAAFNVTDFRAAERTYHQLLDAAALAISGNQAGRVIIQTYLPSHHAVQALAQHQEEIFASEERAHRTALGYPPAVHLIGLHVSGSTDRLVSEATIAWATMLHECADRRPHTPDIPSKIDSEASPRDLVVLGPVAPPVQRLQGRYRRQILVKSSRWEVGLAAVRETVGRLERVYPAHAVKFDVDVDPVEMW